MFGVSLLRGADGIGLFAKSKIVKLNYLQKGKSILAIKRLLW